MKSLAIKYTENSVVKIPIPKVTENPFIGPEPMKKSIIAANNVVMLASIIAVLDFIYPP